MNYCQFVNEVEGRVQGRLTGKIKVMVHTAVKNNGKERTGLMLVQEGVNVSPTIYLEECYEQFQEGKTLEQITEQILRLYREVRFKDSWAGDYIQSFEKIKHMIMYKLINRRKNEKILQDTPYIPFQDLAVVCYALLEMNRKGTATMLVKDEHLKMWDVTKEDVFTQAEENSRKLLPVEFSRMKDVIAEMLELDLEESDEEDFMYVLSNESRSYGAACMLYEGVLEMIGKELGENYYVIPSSVHEVIIIPESRAPEKEEIEEMIAEINETQVEEEEVLSDRVYYYSVKEKRLI